MTEWELDQICERNPDCGCNCMKCPVMAKYMNQDYEDDCEHDEELQEALYEVVNE